MEDRDIQNVREVKADETDEAELNAVAFAIRELKDKLSEFTIVCDHESVVAMINEKKRKSGKKRPMLMSILSELDAHPSIKVELLANNPAHRVLNIYLKEHSNMTQ